ncbi:unnamed protein product [marine sediment metagenome]|uniref:Uncharacterized protein n=1 Tax=marine sediment metagenome TaxID=412755 RepID=X1NKK2_9ZZZZ
MAELICAVKEFHKFIGPRIRNAIQYLTKRRKKELNHICEMCGKQGELEAAHVKGKSRKLVIERILSKYIIDKENKIIKIDLAKVEDEILAAHKPIGDYFKFLCAKCHLKYDFQRD